MILHHIFEKLTPCYDEVINLRFSQPQNMVDSFITLLRVLIVERELFVHQERFSPPRCLWVRVAQPFFLVWYSVAPCMSVVFFFF